MSEPEAFAGRRELFCRLWGNGFQNALGVYFVFPAETEKEPPKRNGQPYHEAFFVSEKSPPFPAEKSYPLYVKKAAFVFRKLSHIPKQSCLSRVNPYTEKTTLSLGENCLP